MRAILLAVVSAVMPAALLLGCQEYPKQMPKTELPQRPASATLPCEKLTDDEIIQCIKTPGSREVCRKLDTTCARYENLKEFVERTWRARDGQ